MSLPRRVPLSLMLCFQLVVLLWDKRMTSRRSAVHVRWKLFVVDSSNTICSLAADAAASSVQRSAACTPTRQPPSWCWCHQRRLSRWDGDIGRPPTAQRRRKLSPSGQTRKRGDPSPLVFKSRLTVRNQPLKRLNERLGGCTILLGDRQQSFDEPVNAQTYHKHANHNVTRWF